MIGEVVRGNSMPDLVSYLFGPGKRNEHVNQHLVAGYADATFTAADRLWQDEPGKQRNVRNEARTLGWQVEFPRSRWRPGINEDHVWHCSLSIPAADGTLTDEQWTEAAHELVRALGFDGSDGKAPCRWIAVRHGLSANGNDHIHIAVNLVREDGTKASTWNDYRKVGRVCSDLEDRFVLTKVHGRMTGRSLPEPSRADQELSAARGDAEPLRTRLERKVRACAAVATSEEHFTRLAADRGLLVRPRYSSDGSYITGYAFADTNARRTSTGSPVWFGGGKLAPDLTATRLRERWQASVNPAIRAADAVAAAAVASEPGQPGALSHAARHLARAAQEPALATAVVTTMADTFITLATAGDTLQLAREIDALITDCLVAARTSHARTEMARASTLVRATTETLTQQAEDQARTALREGDIMTEPSHEEEILQHLTQAGVLTARLARTLLTPAETGVSADIQALRAAGYTETTPYDGTLRTLLGEARWAAYAADPGRIKTAAAITDAARAGRDIPALLERAVNRRAWEDDAISPSRSIAHVLTWRITRELARPATRRTPASVPSSRPASDDITTAADPQPPVTTPYDDTLRDLLGPDRWRQYAEDPRRAAAAQLITQAAEDGHDVPALLTQVVTCREFEDDPYSPARRVAGVLHYRLSAALTDNKTTDRKGQAAPPRRPAPRTDGRESR